MQALNELFRINDFIPHGYCLTWDPVLLWLTVLSDAVIALSYFSIPLGIAYFVWRRKELQYRWLLLMFVVFIVACGTTHLLSIITIWLPLYWLDAYVKAITAIVSVATAVAMLWVVPRALTLPSPAELRAQRDAAQYARSLIEASLDPLVTISPDGKITDVNAATEHATGRNRSELIGTDFSDYFTEPDKAREGYQRVLHEGWVTDYPLTLRHASNKVMDVLYNASVYRHESGEVAGVFAAARDVTERSRAEEKIRYLAAIVESSDDAITGKTLEGVITSWNKGAEKMYGYGAGEIIGQSMSGLILPQHHDELSHILQTIKDGRHVDHFETERKRKDGSLISVSLSVSPISDANGKIVGAATVARDITERKQAEAQLHKYHEHLEELVQERTGQLETANKELEGFAYSVSHDLRVPLRAIDGFSQQVLKRYADKLDDEGQRYLNVVRDNTKKMSQLIDDILAFSRMGRLGMSTSDIDMDAMAHAVFEELRPSFAGRELTLDIKPLPHCHGDASMLHQVWINLLGNAIKFTRPKALAQIEVTGHTEGAENIFCIKDNGAGFDMQYADKLFGVFQRLHGVAEFEGTGIGLAIVKRIITRHGGRVWAQGKVDEGTTFFFALPIQEKTT